MNGQMSIFDCFPDLCLKPGDYVKKHGAVICHVMRPAFIGKLVVIDRSTEHHEWWQVGRLEDYIPYEGRWRSIVYTGKPQRSLITHYPGVEIYEVKPWSFEDRRRKWEQTDK